jgi:ATP-dependent DNA helicase RecG
MLSFNTPLKNIPLILPKYQKILAKLGLLTVSDLLFYLPFRYKDFSKIVTLKDKYLDQNITIEGSVKKTNNFRSWKKKMSITNVIVQDKNNSLLKATWFNQPFILENLKENTFVRLSGKLIKKGNNFQMLNPAWEKATRETTNTGCLVPVYRETTGITSRWIRWQIKSLLPLAQKMPDIIDANILAKYHLYNIYTTLCQLHFPDSQEKLIRAQKRIAFEEMFLAQLKALQTRQDWKKKKAFQINFDKKLIKHFVNNLPFKLTNAQKKSSFEIIKDLEKSQPMNRLLNGDVGSGKTVVASIATLQTLSAGYQVALMAPTEILAQQHFTSFCELFKETDFTIALLTNTYRWIYHKQACKTSFSRQQLLTKIKTGKINLVIGTHALIQKAVEFKDLALIIIDEQHRFGVAQRAFFQNRTMSLKSRKKTPSIPHLLTMTATPIPRTLSIAYFGSLDLSILDEMPKNRRPIITRLVLPKKQPEVYTFVRSEINQGRQAFIVLPLIEESTSTSMSEVKAATLEYEVMSKKIFPEFKVGLLHGKLKAQEKEQIMQDFKKKKISILVSTSVIEVGIDIPNATIMIVENAERFGLAQLHQFRGRIGRGTYQSYCFLFSQSNHQRLKALVETTDGFKIAEKDLALRGPGHFFGILQSGKPDIAMKNLTNLKLIQLARLEAKQLLKEDPQFEKHPLLQKALRAFTQKIHLE